MSISRKTLFKLIALMVAALMVMAVTAGCGGGTPAPATTAAAETTTAAAAATTAAAETTAAATTTAAGAATTTAAPAATTAAATTAAPAATTAAATQAEPVASGHDEHMDFSVVRRITEAVEITDDIFAREMLKRFNVSFDVENIMAIDYLTRIQLRFAIGDVADLIAPTRAEWGFYDLLRDGFIRGFTDDEINHYIPEYIPMWGPDKWPTIRGISQWSNGNVYIFHGERAQITNQAWIFRGDYMDQYNLEYPETIDEFTDLMRHFRDNTGKIPFVWQMQNDPLNAIVWVMAPFNMPELAQREFSYIDMRTGKFHANAFSTEDWRDALKYLNMIHSEGLLWTEFTTATAEQRNSLWTQGHGFTMWGWVTNIDSEYNLYSKQFDPNAHWEWSPLMIANDPSQGTFFKRDPYHNADGFAFGAHMDGERLERLGEFVSWFCGKEGYDFAAFGIEGENWNYNADGIPVLADYMQSPTNPTGVKFGNLGFFFGVSSHKEKNYYYYPAVRELEAAVADTGKYLWHPQLSLIYNDEETKTMADIQTSIRDTAGEFCARFVVGQLDPNNDAHWDEYINTLNRMGNTQFEEIRTEAFWRGSNQHLIDAYNITR